MKLAGLCNTVLSHVCLYQNVTECDTDTSCEVNCSFHTCPVPACLRLSYPVAFLKHNFFISNSTSGIAGII